MRKLDRFHADLVTGHLVSASFLLRSDPQLAQELVDRAAEVLARELGAAPAVHVGAAPDSEDIPRGSTH
jgi:hypothetical protein